MAKSGTIILGSDHAGFHLKEHIKKTLEQLELTFIDIGPNSSQPGDDYPVYMAEIASGVSNGEYTHGIAIDGIGVGASIVANRFPHVRAALCMNSEMARIARSHNDSNVLILGGWVHTPWLADEILKTWLKTRFEGGRHQRRVNLIDDETSIKLALNHLAQVETTQLPQESISDQLANVASKAIERINQLLRADNRRHHIESRLTEYCSSTITSGSQKYSALMNDLSESGAQFRMNSISKKFALKIGDNVEIEVNTPYGKSKASAKIMWIDHSFHTSFGVQFTKLAKDKKDPLRCLMDTM